MISPANDSPAVREQPSAQAPYRAAGMPAGRSGALTWFQVPGRLSSFAAAFSTVAVLAVLAAGLNRALGPQAHMTQSMGELVLKGSGRLYLFLVPVVLVGFPLLFPVLFRLMGRRVGRGACSVPATSGAIMCDDSPVAMYRPDARLFGYDPAALADVAARRGAEALFVGGMSTPIPVWSVPVAVLAFALCGANLFVGVLSVVVIFVWAVYVLALMPATLLLSVLWAPQSRPAHLGRLAHVSLPSWGHPNLRTALAVSLATSRQRAQAATARRQQ